LYSLLSEWTRDDVNVYFNSHRSEEHENEVWKAMQKLRIKAQRCGELEKPESSWSHEVIRPLIDLALEYTPWQDTVYVESM
jgi:hypothetical protein